MIISGERIITKEQQEAFDKLLENIDKINLDELTEISLWSQPIYDCPKCGGGMCKCILPRLLSALPGAEREWEYRCDNPDCNYVEYLKD